MSKAAILNDATTLEQAETFVSLLIQLTRQVFVADGDQVSELPLAQLRLCAILVRGPRPMSSLSRELGVSLSAMTQVADRLERANLVQRVAAGTDRRIKRLQLTPRGEKIMRAREQSRIQRVRVALENASPKARKEILNGLEMFVDACGKVKRQEIGGGRA